MSNDGLGQVRGVFRFAGPKTDFHRMAMGAIEALGASVLTTEFHLCRRDCLLQHVILEADLASLADALSKRSLFGVKSSRWMHQTVFGPGVIT
jgi:hypothetical protein